MDMFADAIATSDQGATPMPMSPAAVDSGLGIGRDPGGTAADADAKADPDADSLAVLLSTSPPSSHPGNDPGSLPVPAPVNLTDWTDHGPRGFVCPQPALPADTPDAWQDDASGRHFYRASPSLLFLDGAAFGPNADPDAMLLDNDSDGRTGTPGWL